jgi:hypothetical protein
MQRFKIYYLLYNPCMIRLINMSQAALSPIEQWRLSVWARGHNSTVSLHDRFGCWVNVFFIKNKYTCFVLELPSLCFKLNVLFWSCRLYVPSWMVCFGVGVFIYLVEYFVLELPSLCSQLNVLLWSCRLYVPSWLLCFGVDIFMFLVECFV